MIQTLDIDAHGTDTVSERMTYTSKILLPKLVDEGLNVVRDSIGVKLNYHHCQGRFPACSKIYVEWRARLTSNCCKIRRR